MKSGFGFGVCITGPLVIFGKWLAKNGAIPSNWHFLTRNGNPLFRSGGNFLYRKI
jgi:hypothetical protein